MVLCSLKAWLRFNSCATNSRPSSESTFPDSAPTSYPIRLERPLCRKGRTWERAHMRPNGFLRSFVQECPSNYPSRPSTISCSTAKKYSFGSSWQCCAWFKVALVSRILFLLDKLVTMSCVDALTYLKAFAKKNTIDEVTLP